MISSEIKQAIPVNGEKLIIENNHLKIDAFKYLKERVENTILNFLLKSIRPLHSPFKTK